ncbi:MAG: arginine--tRNA ligase, partial [Bacteroidales bacterium]|nr:arginine--tRNA ligase [Bacteroidales bacterium]
MTTEQFIAGKASEAVKALYGADFPQEQMQVGVTRKDFEGDYTLVVFPLLRTSRQAPAVTAQAIGEWLTANCPEIRTFNAVQGFLNLSLSNIYWRENLQEITGNASFGQLPATGRRVMVEFSSPNTNKPLHLGHIRNNLLGD